MKVKDRLMVYITLGVLGFIGLVLLGEYLVILYATNQTGEVIGTEPDVIVLVQNALVGLIGIIGGYFGGKPPRKSSNAEEKKRRFQSNSNKRWLDCATS
jgi:hypothetical protein